MHKISPFISLMILVSTLALPHAGAANVKSGATCTKAGATSTVSNVKFTCVKSGERLVWDKGVAVIKPPTPIIQQTIYYVAKDQKILHHLIDNEGCANPTKTKAEIQVLVAGKWLPIKPINSGWQVKPQSCPVAQLGKKDSLAWADVYLDPGVTFRWYFKGEVNIRLHDSLGNGYSASDTLPIPIPAIIPHPVEGGYGITWQNIAQRINDISAAAWTDAQLTLLRNRDLPNAGPGLTTYISPNAARLDNTLLTEVNAILNRTFTLFARIPSSSHIFFIATTFEDAAETKEALKGIYPNSKFMRDSIDSIYALDQNPLAGTPFTYTGCGDNYYGRNTFTSLPNTREAQAVILGVCPMLPGGIAHFNGVQGMSHEYVHSIQIGLRPNTYDSFANIPCWMVEGEAEWTQTAMATNFSNYLRSQNFQPYLLSSAGRDSEGTTAREWNADEVQSYYLAAADTLTCHDTNQYAYSYSLGAATIEALVSIGGSESFFALHERLISGETMNESFNTVYGITWDAASPILAQVVAKKITLAWSKTALTYQTRP